MADDPSFLEAVHDLVFSGAHKIGGTWAGPECAAKVNYDIHYQETAAWMGVSLVLFFLFNVPKSIREITSYEADVGGKKTPFFVKILEVILAILNFFMWLQVLHYKINLKSLVNLLQPCHISVLFQGIALLSRGATANLLTIITLPMTIGAIAAMVVPATEGLDPYEELWFFIQHYVLIASPIVLLVRNGYASYKLANFRNILFANWFAIVLHWIFFSPFNRYFQVNVNFFLCPSEGLGVALDSLPSHLMLPSYRTFLTVGSFFVAIPVCWVYLLIVFVIKSIFGPKDKSKEKTK